MGVGGGGRGPGMGFWWVFEGKMREFEKSGGDRGVGGVGG